MYETLYPDGTQKDQRDKKNKKRNLAQIITFNTLIFGITIASVLNPTRAFSENENRALATKPKFTFDALIHGKYTSDYEKYITDQFVLRDQWIGLKTRTELLLQKKDINNIYFGKDDYLIQKVDATDVDYEQVEKNITRVEEFVKKYSKLLGKDHVFTMIAPTAFGILEEKLPPFATGYDQDAVLDEIAKRIPENTIDIRDALKSHSAEYIFYRTDHHWTTLGAYYAYEAWANRVGEKPLSKEEFEIRKVSDSFYGTNYSKVHVNVTPDDMYIFDSLKKFTVQYNMDGIIKDSLYEMSFLDVKDKYSMYLNGNNAFVEINSELKNGKKLLVIKDSYAHSFTPFVANHYETTYMIDFRYFNLPVSIVIEEYGITDVLILYNANSFIEDKNIYNLSR